MFLKLTNLTLWGYGLQSPLNVRDHASQPYRTTFFLWNLKRFITVLYILIFKFLERDLEDKSVWTE